MATPNLLALNTITGMTSAIPSVATTGSVLISQVTTNHAYRINSIIAANKTASSANITVVLNRGTVYQTLAYQLAVPGNTLISIIGRDTPVYMMDTSSDILSASCNTANAIDVTVSYEDLS